MEIGIDFLQCLEIDMAAIIFKCLDDPADLVRASLVSQNWHDFVVSSGLSKQLCLEMFPELSNILHVDEPASRYKKESDVGSSKSVEGDILQTQREHRVYASLLQALIKLQSVRIDCISAAFSASSTDNYPDESVMNTLDPRIRLSRRGSYWSSKGQKDPTVPETLVYKLKADVCVISEICARPFQAYFQPGHPIYSCKSVRFRMGHPKNPKEIESDLLCLPLQQSTDEKFVWTYTSEEFPMSQVNRLQHFKFQKPVVCIGGYLEVQLLGRVQRQEMDGLLYICVAHVKVLGSPLSPAFEVDIDESSGKLSLKYFPDALQLTLQTSADGGDPNSANAPNVASEEIVWRHVGLLQYLVGENHLDEDNRDQEEEDHEEEENEEEDHEEEENEEEDHEEEENDEEENEPAEVDLFVM